MKRTEEIMEILAAYDLTGSFRDAAALVGCDHHTVARYVRAREAGQVSSALQRRDQRIDPFREKVEEWVDASHGRVRADVAHRKLEAMGYGGSERTTRRAVADAKAVYRAGHRRRFRPWLPEPGLWFQWDYADGPLVEQRRSWLWCAWLAWSKHRVVLPIRDKTLPTVIACIDVTLHGVDDLHWPKRPAIVLAHGMHVRKRTRDVADEPLHLSCDVVLDDEDVRCTLDEIAHFVFGERMQRIYLIGQRGRHVFVRDAGQRHLPDDHFIARQQNACCKMTHAELLQEFSVVRAPFSRGQFAKAMDAQLAEDLRASRTNARHGNVQVLAPDFDPDAGPDGQPGFELCNVHRL